MKKHWIVNTILIFGLLCLLWTGWAFGQPFPKEPTIRLGKGGISDITYSPDGQLLVVAGSVGVWLYDANDLTEVGLLQGHKHPVQSVAFSPDGKILASASREILLWDVQALKQVGQLEKGNWPIAFSPDGKTLASGGPAGSIHLWDVQRRELVETLEGHAPMSVNSIAFSPDGKMLASGGWDDTIRLWDVETQQEIWQITEPDWVYLVAFSPDGALLVTIGNFDRAVRLWDVETRKLVAELKEQTWRVKITFSPDGKLLALGSGLDQILLWDMQQQKQVAVFGKKELYLRLLAFHPDGKRLASLGQDRTIRIWDIETGRQIGMVDGYTDSVESVFLSPNGKILVTNGPIWDVEAQKQIVQREPISAMGLSADGRWIVALGNGGFRIWDIQQQEKVAFLKGGHGGIVRSAVFSPDAELLATGGDDRNIRLWDIEKEEQIAVLQGHTGSAETLAFSPDGKLLASGGRWPDTTVRLWSVQRQKQLAVLRGHTGGIKSVAFSPDGKLLASGSWDNPARLWDVQKKEPIAMLHSSGEAVAFSPDGKLLATAQGKDFTVQLWDVEQGEQVAALKGHTGWVRAVAFSRNGKWLASGSRDGTVLLWEVNLPSPYPVEPKGKRIITLGELKRTMLLQNFPNPFNPETWIPYRLNEPAHVRIQIHDAFGRLVRTLDLGEKPAGNYLSQQKAAYWNGRNDLEETVSSGIYFYTLEAGDYRATQRMSVVR